MKRINFFTTLVLLIGISLISESALAQRGYGRRMMDDPERGPRMGQCIVDLTPEQETQITELRTKHLKEVTPLRNELGEKRARLRTLESAEKPDLNEINKIIDEMASLRATIQKKGAAHRAEVASLLTDDQKVAFKAQRPGRKGNRGPAMGRGMGRGFGDCPYND